MRKIFYILNSGFYFFKFRSGISFFIRLETQFLFFLHFWFHSQKNFFGELPSSSFPDGWKIYFNLQFNKVIS